MELGEVAVLRQLIGQIQELCDLYGYPSPPLLRNDLYQRCLFLDLNSSNIEDGFCHLINGVKLHNTKMGETDKVSPAKKSRIEKSHENMVVNANSSVIMEQKIWKEFPEDLFEIVIARLPTASIFRFRSVCQKWNALLTSPIFSEHCATVRRAQPWFYLITQEHNGVMYDHSLKKWHHRPIPSLPPRKVLFPVTSAGGLICFMDIGHRKFYVCNPLTSSFEKLPPRSTQDLSRVTVGMILNGKSASNGYKIVWLACNGEHKVYDSVNESWTCPGIMPSSIGLPLCLNFRSQAVSIDNSIYFVRSQPDGIISYDVANGLWKQFIIPLPNHLTDRMLAECDGRIMLVGLLTKNAATCVYVWELQKMTLLWKEVDRMPNIWCLDFYGAYVRMTCLGNRGLLMLSLRSRQMNRLVTYDLFNRKWQKVPECVFPDGKERQWVASGTAFYPCPTALA